MSIKRLKTLIAIDETGSFAAAAEMVFLTPAAVSQQMKALEGKLGIVLFDRNTRSPRLSPLGRALIPKAREVVEAFEDIVPSLTGDIAGKLELTIGAVPTTMSGLMPKVLGSLKKLYTGLHIRVIPGLSGELFTQVERGFLDAAIMTEPVQVPVHLRSLPFADEPLVLLAPQDVPEDDPEVLVRSYPFIRFNRRAWVGEQVDEWLRSRNLPVEESMELDTLESISSMVYYKLGVSIVPMHCVPAPHQLDIKRIPLGPSAKPRRLGLLLRCDSKKYRLAEVLFAELKSLVEAADVARLREDET